MIQLKNAAEVAVVRTRLLKQQDYKCGICGCSLKGKIRGGPVLDHDHDTGVVRGVLCKVCNTGEGKFRTVAVRYGGGKESALKWAKALVAYRSIHAKPLTSYLYPIKKKKPVKRKGTK